MKNFIIVLIVAGMLNAFDTFALTTRNYTQAMDKAPGGGVKKSRETGHKWVHIICGTNACYLECGMEPGSKRCRYEDASYCEWCDRELAENANVQEMFDFAVMQIDSFNVEIGSYTSNLVSGPSGGNIYYRTIV